MGLYGVILVPPVTQMGAKDSPFLPMEPHNKKCLIFLFFPGPWLNPSDSLGFCVWSVLHVSSDLVSDSGSDSVADLMSGCVVRVSLRVGVRVGIRGRIISRPICRPICRPIFRPICFLAFCLAF